MSKSAKESLRHLPKSFNTAWIGIVTARSLTLCAAGRILGFYVLWRKWHNPQQITAPDVLLCYAVVRMT